MDTARHPVSEQTPIPGAADPREFVYPLSDAHEWTLENGMELIVKEDRSAPVASVQAWCRAGSIHEGRWLGAGLSHLLEHMMFKGTETRTGSQIVEAVQDEGGYFNAYTSFNRTVYWIDTPKGGVDTALEILCDITSAASFPEDELDREVEVIRREIAMGEDDPEQVLSRMTFATAFAVHPCRYPVIGTLELLNRVRRDDLIGYYRSQYIPNNLFFVVVGDVDARAIYEKLRALAGKIERGVLEPVLLPDEPRQLGRREYHGEFVTKLSRTSLAWHIPDVTHPDVPALDVLATVLGAGKSSRFYRFLREREKLAHSVYAYAYTPGHEGLFLAGATVEPGKRRHLEERVLEMVAEAARDGIDAVEVEKARKIALSDQFHSLTTTRGQASDLGSNWLLARNLDFSGEYLDALAKVTPEQVRKVARDYLREENLTLTSLNPKGSLEPKPKSKTRVRGLSVERFLLSNGLTVLVREDDRLPLISCFATFRGGLLAETPGTGGITRLLSRLLVKGSAKSTAESIADRIEGVGGSLAGGSGRNSLYVGLDVLRTELRPALQVLGEICLEASFPPEELEKERQAQLAAIRDSEDDPFTAASQLMRAALYGDHPYSLDIRGTLESVANIGRDDLLGARGELISGANGVLAIFGKVGITEVRELVEENLSALAAGTKLFADRTGPARGMLAETRRVEGDLEKSQAVVMLGFPACNIFHPDRYALEILDEICSDLSSRLFLKIREELGLAYTVGSSLSYGFDPGGFVLYAATSPEKAAVVEDALAEEAAKMGKEGVSAAELARAKKTFLGKRMMGRQSNASLAEALALDELYGLGWEIEEVENREVEALTLEGVNAAAASYLGEAPRIIASLQGKPGTN